MTASELFLGQPAATHGYGSTGKAKAGLEAATKDLRAKKQPLRSGKLRTRRLRSELRWVPGAPNCASKRLPPSAAQPSTAQPSTAQPSDAPLREAPPSDGPQSNGLSLATCLATRPGPAPADPCPGNIVPRFAFRTENAMTSALLQGIATARTQHMGHGCREDIERHRSS